MYCIHIAYEERKLIDRGSIEVWGGVQVLTNDDNEVVTFSSEEEALEYLREGAFYDLVFGLDILGFTIHRFFSAYELDDVVLP